MGRSVLESGLFDATPEFLLFIAVSLMVEGGSRPRLQAESDVVASRIGTTRRAVRFRSRQSHVTDQPAKTIRK